MRRSLKAVLLTAGLLAATGAGAPQPPASVGRFARPEIVESSAVAASVRQPGVYWTLNDSGGAPVVYAFDLGGRDLGAWVVKGATNEDWESLSVGPCGPGGKDDCLYIGETGDNGEHRPFRTLYRIPEPVVGAAPPASLLASEPAERLDYVYDDGPHDVEALYVAADASAWLVTKGRSKGIAAFRLDPGAWGRDGPATARKVAALPIEPGLLNGALVTDAGLSPDGAALAVRTYRTLYVFHADPATGAPSLETAPSACDLAPLREAQGEGVGWHPTGKAQVLTSEGIAGQISLIECPTP